MGHASQAFEPLSIAILTISDTRETSTDTSGNLLVDSLTAAGHKLVEKRIVKDDVYLIRKHVSDWIADESVQVILTTGGTGFTSRDSTPEALEPLFDKTIIGFGETFRQISLEQVGSSTIQSRAIAGLANKTVIFAMPGSQNACKTAWNGIIKEQLDATHKPCNFVGQLKR